MNNKALRRNVIPATALAAATTLISQTEQATYEKGIRLFITITGAATTGGVDAVFLCAVPPAGGVAIPLAGPAGASFLSTNGVYVVDFYPGAWLPDTLAAGGNLLGAFGIQLPMNYAVQLVTAGGSSATVTVDAEVYPC